MMVSVVKKTSRGRARKSGGGLFDGYLKRTRTGVLISAAGLAFLLAACREESIQTTAPVKKTELKSTGNVGSSAGTEEISRAISCSGLNNRIDELESMIILQERISKQALSKAREQCREDLVTECNFWFERATELSREIRKLRGQQQQLFNRKIETGCS